MTAAQREIWLAQQPATDRATFRIAEYALIYGPVDKLPEAAVQAVAAEATCLHKRVVQRDSEPHQTVRVAEDWSSLIMDAFAEAALQAAAEAWTRAGLSRSPDAADSLSSCTRFRLQPPRLVLYQCVHPISTDGWSAGLLTRRVAKTYTAFAQGGSAPPGTCPPRVLVAHEAAYRGSPRYAADHHFWLGRLADRPERAGLAAVTGPAAAARQEQWSTAPTWSTPQTWPLWEPVGNGNCARIRTSTSARWSC